MDEAAELTAEMAGHRKRRDKLARSLQRLHTQILGLQRSEEFSALSAANITDRGTDYSNLHFRLSNYMDLLLDEEDDDLADADAVVRREFLTQHDQAKRIVSKLVAIKNITKLLNILEIKICDVEQMKIENPGRDYSACYHPLDKIAEAIQGELASGGIEEGDVMSQQAGLLSKRLLEVKTNDKPEAKPASFESMASRNIDAPKVNMPDFHGDLLSWPPFWSRFNASVHESTKLTSAMKMAVLMDRIKDPGITKYLIAANDGRPGRYDEVILYLKDRFNRPRELHQVYLQQLIDLPPIEGTPAEISKAVDTVYSAVTAIKGSGQDSIEHIATSLVVSILPDHIRQEWENKTDEMVGVPPITNWITFMRKKATQGSQRQKGTAQPIEPLSQPKHPKDKRKKPTQGKVYSSHGDSAPAGENDHRPNKGRKQQQPKAAGYGRITCTVCSSNHHVFQCQQFLDMTVSQRRDHTQGASLCFNCLRPGHAVKDCSSTFRCRLCKKTHNTLLHTESTTAPVTVNHIVHHSQGELEATPSATPSIQEKERLLMTSQVYLTMSLGEKIQARAMLDSGAAISVLSSRMMAQLHIQAKEYMTVSGVESQKNSPADLLLTSSFPLSVLVGVHQSR